MFALSYLIWIAALDIVIFHSCQFAKSEWDYGIFYLIQLLLLFAGNCRVGRLEHKDVKYATWFEISVVVVVFFHLLGMSIGNVIHLARL